jgi:multicomponent K+:H+ antiporter subunit E
MKRLFPYPVLAALLLLLWLVLQQSIGLGQILLGGAVAIAVSLAASAILPGRVRFRRITSLVQLIAVAGIDIIRSNISVLLILINPRASPVGRLHQDGAAADQPVRAGGAGVPVDGNAGQRLARV